jgi:hypothetical protein
MQFYVSKIAFSFFLPNLEINNTQKYILCWKLLSLFKKVNLLLTVLFIMSNKFILFVFQDLKGSIDECISHVIGTATPTNGTPPFHSHNSRSPLDHCPRSRGSSPSPRSRTAAYRVSRSQPDTAVTSAPPSTQRSLSAQNSQSGADSPSETADEIADGVVAEIVTVPVLHKGKCHHEVILVGC